MYGFGKKTTSFDLIISHCGERVLLRGGRTEDYHHDGNKKKRGFLPANFIFSLCI
nr:MAG TPA: hypothetical protein [Caudoviricetes sp.]